MNYNTLREQYFDNCNISKWKQDVVAKFINHCEENNVPLEQVIFYLYDENQVGCYHDCDKCATPIC